MFALGSALAMLLVGLGVDMAAVDRSAASSGHDNDDAAPSGDGLQGALSHDDAESASGDAPENADERAGERADGSTRQDDLAHRPTVQAAVDVPDAEMDALVREIDAFLAEDPAPADPAARDTAEAAPASPDEAPDAETEAEASGSTDFLAFLDGPDGLFDDEAGTPEPHAADDLQPRDLPGEDDLATAFDNDELFGEHSIDALFAKAEGGLEPEPELDIVDYTPGTERLVMTYDDDGTDAPDLQVVNRQDGETRLALIQVGGETVARVGLAPGARDMTADDIALFADG
ncbi:hypothetical protein [Anianabacter salinae]|uniref:hypothetical protein n=1 Tax=Anianabacter salinae TaxID=2851023 RepID=UPI00225E1192|nr:hypothetical protein [Anianabacter salinae]MBV0913358.1 hypothetical protein [Anianabacter salinae]